MCLIYTVINRLGTANTLNLSKTTSYYKRIIYESEHQRSQITSKALAAYQRVSLSCWVKLLCSFSVGALFQTVGSERLTNQRMFGKTVIQKYVYMRTLKAKSPSFHHIQQSRIRSNFRKQMRPFSKVSAIKLLRINKDR